MLCDLIFKSNSGAETVLKHFHTHIITFFVSHIFRFFFFFFKSTGAGSAGAGNWCWVQNILISGIYLFHFDIGVSFFRCCPIKV